REERDRAEVVLERSPGEVQRNEWEDERADRHFAPEPPKNGDQNDERNCRQPSVDGARQKRERTVEAEPHETYAVWSERAEHRIPHAVEERGGVVDHERKIRGQRRHPDNRRAPDRFRAATPLPDADEIEGRGEPGGLP